MAESTRSSAKAAAAKADEPEVAAEKTGGGSGGGNGGESGGGSGEAFSIGRLISEAPDFLGVEPHVAAGAFHDLDSDELTQAAAQSQVEKWLGTEVQTENPVAEPEED